MAKEIHEIIAINLTENLGPGDLDSAKLLTARALQGDVGANEQLRNLLDRAQLLRPKRSGIRKLLRFIGNMPAEELPDVDDYIAALSAYSNKSRIRPTESPSGSNLATPEVPASETKVLLDIGRGLIQVDGKAVKLAPQQMKVVQQLLSKPSAPSTLNEIAMKIFGKDEKQTRKRASTLVAQTREAMGDTTKSPKYIINCDQGGYQFTRNPNSVSVSVESGPNDFTNIKDFATKWGISLKTANDFLSKLPDKAKNVIKKDWPRQTYLIPAGIAALERLLKEDSEQVYKKWKDVPPLTDREQAFLAHHLQETIQLKQDELAKKFSVILDETATLQLIDACGEGIERIKEGATPLFNEAIKLTNRHVIGKLEGLALDPKQAQERFGDSRKKEYFSPITSEMLKILQGMPNLESRKKFIAWIFEINKVTFRTDTRNSFFQIDITSEAEERWRRNK